MKAWIVHQKYGDATAIVFAETAEPGYCTRKFKNSA